MLSSLKTTTMIDRATFTIRFEREFRAPPEAVFDAWTLPAEVTGWWDPTGAPLVACTIDLRPGGAFAFVSSGHAPPFAGTYREVARPTKLVFDAMGALGTVLLEGGADATHMVVTIACASAEHFAQFLALGVDQGTAITLDNLVAHVHARRGSA